MYESYLNLKNGKMENLLDVLMKDADYGDEEFIPKSIINAKTTIAASISCLQPGLIRLLSFEAALRNRRCRAPAFGQV